jgi:hypothetical protein
MLSTLRFTYAVPLDRVYWNQPSVAHDLKKRGRRAM